ncbi:MAG TPA: hypothetical protein PKE55_08700 [Kiritimatiellia bacterium]|nr:hypothetical protein [Kiritimatiellia bacterium]
MFETDHGTLRVRLHPQPDVDVVEWSDGTPVTFTRNHALWLVMVGMRQVTWHRQNDNPSAITMVDQDPQLLLPGFAPRYLEPHLREELMIPIFRTDRDRQAVADFVEAIPPVIQAAWMKHGFYQKWDHLAALMGCRHALELCCSNHSLFYLVLSAYITNGYPQALPYERLDHLFSMKRTQMLEHLVLPASESNCRILSKCTLIDHRLERRNAAPEYEGKPVPEDSYPEIWHNFHILNTRWLLGGLHEHPSVRRLLEHAPKIGRGLQMVFSYRSAYPYLTGSLVNEIAGLDDREEWNAGLRICDTVRLLTRCGIMNRKIHSIRGGKRLHEEMCRRLPEEVVRENLGVDAEFPRPPYPGTDGITPITKLSTLMHEGIVMAHCVGTLAAEVKAGTAYFYRVTKPVRATLQIGSNQRGGWEYREIQSYCNEDILEPHKELILAKLFSGPCERAPSPCP